MTPISLLSNILLTMRTLLLSIVFLSACTVTPFPDHGRFNYTAYTFHPTRTTAAGNIVDDQGNQVSDAVVDGTIKNALDCFNSIPHLTFDEREKAACEGHSLWGFDGSIKVKVVTDWHVSACSGKQLFSCYVPDASCEAKNLPVHEFPDGGSVECPCECRAMIQDDDFIATAPNLELLPWQVVELVSGCEHIEFVERLSLCGAISMVAK